MKRQGRVSAGGSKAVRHTVRFLALAVGLTVAPGLAASPAPSAAEPLPQGRVIDPVICGADATQTYALYLPSTYDPKRAWPALYCFDPMGRGRVPVELFRAAAERFGYVVAGSNNAHNGPWADNVKAVAALVTDTGGRLSLDARRLYAAGLSGAARLATGVAGSGLFRGVIACSAAFAGGVTPAKVPYALFGTAGRDDFNYPEMVRTDRELDTLGSAHRVVFFPGPHDWPPPAVAAEAVAWLELQAMRTGVRPRDPAFIAAYFAQRRTEAEALAPAPAWREYRSLAADFSGLVDTTEVARRAAELARSRAVREWQRAERAHEDRQHTLEDDLFSAARVGQWDWVRERVATLRAQAGAADDSADRRIARRALEGTGIGAVEQADLRAADRRYGEAVTFMQLAAILRPDSSQTLYRLARVQALHGERPAALEALQSAVDHGFRDAARAQRDEAFAALRGDAAFQRLLMAMKP